MRAHLRLEIDKARTIDRVLCDLSSSTINVYRWIDASPIGLTAIAITFKVVFLWVVCVTSSIGDHKR